MIQTGLFNQIFQVVRNNPTNVDGIIEDNFIDTGIEIKGRLSAPTHRESTLFQSRGMNLTAVIYCEPYAFDKQRDYLINDDIIYQIKDLTPTRDRDGAVAFLKIFVDESDGDIDINESSDLAS